MSYRKNVAGQFVYFALVDSADGSAMLSASVTAKRSIDGGTQGACTGTINEKGNGQYELAASQADMNGNDIGFFFTATAGSPPVAAIPVSISIVTTAGDPTDSVRGGLTALPNAAAGANTGLPVVGTQIPNATAAASGGLPTVDATNSVKIQTPLKRNTALTNFTFSMFDTAGLLATGLTVSATRSIDGAAPAACANSVTEVTTGAGRYKINLAATDLNGTEIEFQFTAAGAKPLAFTVHTLP